MNARTRLAQILAVVLLMTTSPMAFAAPVAPSKPSQIISAAIFANGLLTVPCPGTAGFLAPSFVGKADGSTAPFAIPPKSVFVLTSITYTITGQEPSTVGSIQLRAANPGILPLTGAFAFTIVGAMADATGTVVDQFVLPTGMVFKPPATPCVGVVGAKPAVVILHGFFAKDN